MAAYSRVYPKRRTGRKYVIGSSYQSLFLRGRILGVPKIKDLTIEDFYDRFTYPTHDAEG